MFWVWLPMVGLAIVQNEEGIPVKAVELSRKITPIQDLKSLWAMYRLLKKESPQIVHTHTPKAGIIGMLAAKLAGVPHRLHTVAGLPLMEASGNKRTLLNAVEKLTYACATKVYPNSKGLAEFIETNQFTSSNKLKVIANGSSNGINTNHYTPEAISLMDVNKLKAQLGIGLSDFVFIFVGRLVGDKGINELANAFQKIALIYPSSKLLLVGSAEPDLDPLLEETINTITNHPQIISVGFQKDVRPYFAISDALVFPSYREGFPNVVMQAGAMGLPSIVSNINGCNEIIVPDKNGVIIPVKDSKAIANAMESFLTNSQQTLSMRNHARQMIVDRYEQSVVWEALLNEYTHLLKRL